MIKEFSMKESANFKLSSNFAVREFGCKDGSDKVIIDSKLIDILQQMRNYLGKPIKIISAYRTESYNAQCGGASNSYHTKGQASDIRCDGVSLIKLALTASHFGANGIGIYADDSHNFVHIDTRDDFTVFREE